MRTATALPILFHTVWLCALLMAWGVAPAWSHPVKGKAPGKKLGTYKLTYYWVAREKTGGNWPLYTPACSQVLARTSKQFHDDLSLEGTGLLADGRLLNFEQRCKCARPGHGGRRACYSVLDRKKFPWGRGALLKTGPAPLRPFYSVAVDPRRIPVGTMLYIPLWRGKSDPSGKMMDGCFRAEDTGAVIRGHHLDFFAGKPEWARWLDKTYGYSRVAVYRGGRRCPAQGR